jgi:hypothetical protein
VISRAGSSFVQKKGQFASYKENKCFPISFNTFLKDTLGGTLMELVSQITNKNIFFNVFFKGQGAPWEVKGHKGAPWHSWWRQGTAPF